jgi:hypothetical protein
MNIFSGTKHTEESSGEYQNRQKPRGNRQQRPHPCSPAAAMGKNELGERLNDFNVGDVFERARNDFYSKKLLSESTRREI